MYWDRIDDIERDGLTFAVYLAPDDYQERPWQAEAGHGEVREVRGQNWTGHADKRPGERVLWEDSGTAFLYDFAGAVRRAKADGWGLADADRARLARDLGREPSPAEVAVRAVEQDFNRLRTWCAGDWGYCVLRVVLLDVDGEDTAEWESLGGLESDCMDYIRETAADLADEIAASLPDDGVVVIERPGRRTEYRVRAA